MKNDIVKINIQNELDIVLAYKRAKQLAEFTGMNISNQTKFGTAVSEICRNVLEHVGSGTITFNVVDEGRLYLEAMITDRGRGIANPDEYLNRKTSTLNLKGSGIHNAKKLADDFLIETSPDKGTKVRIRKKIATIHPPINNMIIKGWTDHFQNELAVSPYEEIKKQNMEFIEVVDALRIKNIEAEDQIQEIKRLNNELDKFAYIVSHDLKAPLKNIEGLVNMIEDCLEGENTEALGACDMLRGQAKRMEKFITDILSYSKAGKNSVEKTKVDVGNLVNILLQSLKIPPAFEVKVVKELPVIFTEEVFLHQIFSNLISNAIKYHNKENGKVWINFESKDERGYYTFSVQDNGPGIKPKDQQRLFKIYESMSQAREDSSGVGLSIVQGLVNEKGGKVWVESDGESGSSFYFTWPG